MIDATKTLFLFGLLLLAVIVFYGGRNLRRKSDVESLSKLYDNKQKWVLAGALLLIAILLALAGGALIVLFSQFFAFS